MSKSDEELMLEEFKAKKAAEAAEKQRGEKLLSSISEYAKNEKAVNQKAAEDQTYYFGQPTE